MLDNGDVVLPTGGIIGWMGQCRCWSDVCVCNLRGAYVRCYLYGWFVLIGFWIFRDKADFLG